MSPGPDKQFCTEAALSAAIELFRSRGFHGVSTSQLMAAMGIGKKSLYDTFGCKRELFLTALRRYAELSGDVVHQLLSKHGGGLAGIKALLNYFTETNSQRGTRGCLIGVGLADFDTSDPEVCDILVTAVNQLANTFAKHLRLAQKAGDIAADLDYESTARLIVAMQQGLTMVSRADTNNDFAQAVPEQLMALLKPQTTPP